MGRFSSVLPCDSVVFSPAGPEIRAELVADTGAQSVPLLLWLLARDWSHLCFSKCVLAPKGRISSLIIHYIRLSVWWERKLLVNDCDWWSALCWKAPDFPRRLCFTIHNTPTGIFWVVSADCQCQEWDTGIRLWTLIEPLIIWGGGDGNINKKMLYFMGGMCWYMLGWKQGRFNMGIPPCPHYPCWWGVLLRVKLRVCCVSWQLGPNVTAETPCPLFLCVTKSTAMVSLSFFVLFGVICDIVLVSVHIIPFEELSYPKNLVKRLGFRCVAKIQMQTPL